MTKQLIIIPGIGDRTSWLKYIKPFWRLYGFEVHVFVFGWNGVHNSVEIAQQRIVHYIDRLPAKKVYLIGISAGGTAAVNALASSSKVAKVATVCSPYFKWDGLHNTLLSDSLRVTHSNMGSFSKQSLAKILSVHALIDGVVPVIKSRPAGVKTVKLWTIGHAISIFAAMSFLNLPIKLFFKRP